MRVFFTFLTTAGNKLVLHLCNIKSREIKNDKGERSKTQNEKKSGVCSQRAHTNTTQKLFSFLYLTLRALQTRFKNHFLHTSRRWINKIRLFIYMFISSREKMLLFLFLVSFRRGVWEIHQQSIMETERPKLNMTKSWKSNQARRQKAIAFGFDSCTPDTTQQ